MENTVSFQEYLLSKGYLFDPKIIENYLLSNRLTNDEAKNKLEYIFTVDIFNEGVDIPEINQVLLVRPTQSPIIFIQQLGRGLRKF